MTSRGLLVAGFTAALISAVASDARASLPPKEMAAGREFQVNGSGPVDTGRFTAEVFLRSSGTFVKIHDDLRRRTDWMQIPGFYGADVHIGALSPGRIFVVGQKSSETKRMDILDLQNRRTLDEIWMADGAVSPDRRYLVFTRSLPPHTEDARDGSEVTAVYDFGQSPKANHAEYNAATHGHETGQRLYPKRSAEDALPSSCSDDIVYQHIGPYFWAQGSDYVGWIVSAGQYAGAAGAITIVTSTYSLAVAHLVAGKSTVATVPLQICGSQDRLCGSDLALKSITPAGAEITDGTSRPARRVPFTGMEFVEVGGDKQSCRTGSAVEHDRLRR